METRQVKHIDPDTLEYRPREHHDPVPPPTAEELLQTAINVTCPWCSIDTPVRLITDPESQDGFSQKHFSATCALSGCGLQLDHEVLKVGKFLTDLRDIVTGKLEYLPGMRLRPSDGLEDGERSLLFSQLIAKLFIDEFDTDMKLYPKRKDGKGPLRPDRNAVVTDWRAYNKYIQPYYRDELFIENHLYPRMPTVKQIMQRQPVGPNDLASPNQMRYYHDKVNKALEDGRFKTWIAGFRLKGDELPRRLGKMWSAYQTNGIASLNLAEASKRQSGFIAKMKDMGWLERNRFEGEGKAFLLQKSAARYRESA